MSITKHIDNLTLYYKGDMTEEQWVADRNNGLGGSDMGDIFGINPYSSNVQLFYQKLGLVDPADLSLNQKIHWGNEFEPIIRNNAQYIEGDDKDRRYILNKKANKKIRSIVEPKWVITHNDYPHLRANIDGLTYDDLDITDEVFHDAIERGEFIYPVEVGEMKTIGGRASDMWQSGVPPYYILQGHLYMLMFIDKVPDISLTIYSLKDGYEMEHFSIPFSDDIATKIVEKSEDFWAKVQEGREIVSANYSDYQKMKFELEQIEPELKDMGNTYEQFLSDTFLKRIKGKMKGPDKLYNLGLEYNQLKADLKEHPDQRGVRVQEIRNEIKKYMALHEVKILDYGENGKITGSEKSRQLWVNVK